MRKRTLAKAVLHFPDTWNYKNKTVLDYIRAFEALNHLVPGVYVNLQRLTEMPWIKFHLD